MTEKNINSGEHVITRQEMGEKCHKAESKVALLSGLGEEYWKSRFERLQADYNHLQNINQNLEERLLNVVETFERKKEELIANIEYEKSTLMADVNKLSNKLVDAKIRLHDHQEKELIHAAECDAPCHKNNGLDKSAILSKNGTNNLAQPQQLRVGSLDPNSDDYDPHLV